MDKNKIVPKKDFAKNLIYYYKRKGVSQKQIAAAVGVSTGTVCDWTKGRSYPRMDKIQMLADFLECEKSDLIEERSINNTYFLNKEATAIAQNLLDHPEMIEFFRKFQMLSKENANFVESMVDKLLDRGE